MKKHMIVLTITFGTLMLAIPQMLIAHDGTYDAKQHYYVDKSGYWDENDQHQKFITNHNHLGYWDTRSNHGIFIAVD